jgi:hypothetical protein
MVDNRLRARSTGKGHKRPSQSISASNSIVWPCIGLGPDILVCAADASPLVAAMSQF